jgi:hypothetical protein
MASPAAKLCGFLLLLAVVFAGAYAAGARMGPLAPGRAPTLTSTPAPAGTPAPVPAGSGGSGGMNMGGMP